MDYQDYEGNGSICPSCLDNELDMSEQPIWATDQGEIYEVICPHCGVVDTWAEFIDNEEADEFNELCNNLWGGHQGFYVEVDGHHAHVLGDPNMPPEAQQALTELIRCAYRAIEDGTLQL